MHTSLCRRWVCLHAGVAMPHAAWCAPDNTIRCRWFGLITGCEASCLLRRQPHARLAYGCSSAKQSSGMSLGWVRLVTVSSARSVSSYDGGVSHKGGQQSAGEVQQHQAAVAMLLCWQWAHGCEDSSSPLTPLHVCSHTHHRNQKPRCWLWR
jgi:hypothetical protein